MWCWGKSGDGANGEKKALNKSKIISDSNWIVGDKNMSKFDLYVDKNTGEILIYRKGGIGDGISTGEFIK